MHAYTQNRMVRFLNQWTWDGLTCCCPFLQMAPGLVRSIRNPCGILLLWVWLLILTWPPLRYLFPLWGVFRSHIMLIVSDVWTALHGLQNTPRSSHLVSSSQEPFSTVAFKSLPYWGGIKAQKVSGPKFHSSELQSWAATCKHQAFSL